MNYQGSYRKLLENSKAALMAAIEVYNKAAFSYRDECAVILLLNAWEQIHRGSPSACLWLIGLDRFADDPAAERFLEECLARLSPSALSRVRRLGVRDDAQRFLQVADVFLFPSRREGFGTAIIEAMACGVPCIVGELPGITDFIFAAPARSGAPAQVARAARTGRPPVDGRPGRA